MFFDFSRCKFIFVLFVLMVLFVVCNMIVFVFGEFSYLFMVFYRFDLGDCLCIIVFDQLSLMNIYNVD